jgi:hypothetical protein
MKGFCYSLILLVFGNLSFITHSQKDAKSDFLLNSIQTRFEENKGQVTGADADQVKYTFDKGGLQLFVLKTGLAYQFTKVHFPEGQHLKSMRDHIPKGNLQTTHEEKLQTETYRMDLKLINANPNARITTEGKSADFVNYYNHGALDVHSYTKVIYHDIYPNIDWVIYTKNESVKYDFIVHPGGDPTRIQFESVWAEKVQLKPDGSLVLGNRMGEITEQTPVSFQEGHEIATRFQLSDNTIGFDVDSYDKTRDLIIDPTIVWGTYYGSASYDYALFTELDASGNVYLTGGTTSTTNIASGGYQNTFAGGYDAFLTKFNASGVRQWATYLGGVGDDSGQSISIDPSGNIYLCGQTFSTSGIAFSGHQNAQGGNSDGYVAKFSTSGSLIWSTYYGGADYDIFESIDMDASGNVYLVGSTQSASLATAGAHQTTYAGFYDALIVKFNAAGVRQWATYYGGSASEATYGCNIDPSGNLYVVGRTESSTSISFGGFQNALAGSSDAYLAKFNTNGTLIWATYYGGADFDVAYMCSSDFSGNIFISGITTSASGIASGGFQNSISPGSQDVFLVKFNSSGGRIWGTYIGGAGADASEFCKTDNSGNCYVVGRTYSPSGIYFNGFQSTHAGNEDGFILKFDPSGNRIWGSYFGDNRYEEIIACAVDANNKLYICGTTFSAANIATVGAHQTTINGTTLPDAFLVQINDPCIPTVSITSAQGQIICSGTSVDFTAAITNGGATPIYQWKKNGNNVGSNTSVFTTTSLSSGDIITCELTSNATCSGPAITLSSGIAMTVNPTVTPTVSITSAQGAVVCTGTSVDFSATITNGGATPIYQWKKNGNNVGSNSNVFTTSGLSSGDIITCELTSNAACASPATVISSGITMTVNPTVTPTVSITSAQGQTICSGTSVDFSAAITNGGATPIYQWKKNGNNVGSNVSVFTTSSLSSGDIITCELTSNAACASPATVVSSGITMTVNPTVTQTISITSAQGAEVCSGTSVDFSATITNGGATPIYQWKKNGNNVGNNASMFTTSGLSSGDIITCELTSNAACASPAIVISSGITMTVNPTVTPTISITIAQGAVVCTGTSVDFTATTTNGGATPIYQWKKNGNNVGNNASMFTTSGLSSGDIITCELTSNAACAIPATVVSSGITMTVNPTVTPTISITSAQGAVVCTGTSVDFTATITNGGATPIYQWKKNGNNVGSNASVFTTNSLSSGDIITCELTSNAACASPATVASSGITMTVNPTVTPTVSIASAQGAAVCSGTSVDFTATITNGGATPIYQWKKNGNNVGSNASVFTTSSLSSGDIITCELTSNAACASPATVVSSGITMTVNTSPNVSVSVNGITLNSDQTGVDYQWVDCSNLNQEIPGATAQTFTPTSNGNYAVVVSFGNSCADTSDCVAISTIGLNEKELDNSITVYPNPSQGIFVIESRSAITATIIDVFGKVIANIDLKEGSNQIDLSTQARGIYYIQLNSEAQQQSVKRMILH